MRFVHSQPAHAALLVLVALVSGLPAAAQTVTMTTSNPSGSSWETGSGWSDGQPAGAGKDYVVNGGFLVRSPAATDPVFAGNSLTLNGTGELRMKHTGTVTIGTLNLGGVLNNGDNGTKSVAGTVNVLNPASVTGDAASGARTTILNSQVTGAAALNVRQATAGTNTITLVLANPANTYTGLITVQDRGLLQFDYDAPAGGPSVDVLTGGKFNLTRDVTFALGSFRTDGTPLAAGTYDFAALSDQGLGNYFNSGPGTLTVVPEPSSAAGIGLLAAGGCALARRARRR